MGKGLPRERIVVPPARMVCHEVLQFEEALEVFAAL
jgi:hypothetical protein